MSEEKVLTPQEKYLNHYVELLKQTLQQQILNSISLQATAKVNGEVLQEWQKENESLRQQFEELNSKNLQAQDDLKIQIEKLKTDSLTNQSTREQQQNGEIDRLKNLLSGKDDLIKNVTISKDEIIKNLTNSKDEIIKNLQTEINKLNQIRTEYENIKHQVSHVDTFRNELIKSRQEIENIKSQYEGQIETIKNEHEQQLVDLNSQIEYLSLTSAKKKKISVVKQQEEVAQLPLVEENSITKDGGTF
jgi:hypothetical protein